MREAAFSPSSCNSWVQMLGCCFHRLPSAASLSRSCRSLQGQGQFVVTTAGTPGSLPPLSSLPLVNNAQWDQSHFFPGQYVSVILDAEYAKQNRAKIRASSGLERLTSLLGLEADLPIPLGWELDEPRAPKRKIAPGWGSGGSIFSTSVVFKE